MTSLQAILLLAVGSASGEITFDASSRAIHVIGYTQEAPATMQCLLEADGKNGWQVVSYRAEQEAYRLDASLVIGRSGGSKSHFQVRPTETVVLNGSLIVAPGKEFRKHASAALEYRGGNWLRIGLPDDSGVGPVVKFECSKACEHGLQIGAGSQFLCYRARLSAATVDKAHYAFWKGTGAIVGSTVSGFDKLYGLALDGHTDYLIKDCTFEHMNVGLYNGVQIVEGCTFRHMGTAVYDAGCLDAILTNCRFESNERDWALAHTATGIRAVDCAFADPERSKFTLRRWHSRYSKEWQFPTFVAKRHLVFEVKDRQGKPIPGAVVTLSHEKGQAGMINVGRAVTGADGRTPADERALLVTDYLYRATDRTTPIHESYTYSASVAAAGFAPVELTGIDPHQSRRTWHAVLARNSDVDTGHDTRRPATR